MSRVHGDVGELTCGEPVKGAPKVENSGFSLPLIQAQMVDVARLMRPP